MKTKLKKECFQQRVFTEIKHHKGACNVVVMPVAVLRLCGDRNIALMLSHLIYWCDRGSDKEGWIWKSYKEWVKETGLNRYQVDRSTRWLREAGFLEIKKKMAKGHPTLHYKINQLELLDAISGICRKNKMEMSNSTNGHPEVDKCQLPK